MDINKIKAEIAKYGQLMVVTLEKDIPPSIVVENNDMQQSCFVYALWGFVSYETSDHQVRDAVFTAKYRSKPALVGPCEKVELVFAFGKYQAFGLAIDGSKVADSLIRQLAVFAATNRGTVLISYCPAIRKDANELVVSVSDNADFGTVVQHLAAFWLEKIWNSKN